MVETNSLSGSFDKEIFKYTKRQLIGGCLEYMHEALKQGLQPYIQNQSGIDPSELESMDLPQYLNFFITNCEPVSRYYGFDVKNIKTLLIEIKYSRNQWAHFKGDIDFRQVYRIFDTVQNVLDLMKVNQSNIIYQQIDYIRKQVVLEMTQEILNGSKKGVEEPMRLEIYSNFSEKLHSIEHIMQTENFNALPHQLLQPINPNYSHSEPSLQIFQPANPNNAFANITTDSLREVPQPIPQRVPSQARDPGDNEIIVYLSNPTEHENFKSDYNYESTFGDGRRTNGFINDHLDFGNN